MKKYFLTAALIVAAAASVALVSCKKDNAPEKLFANPAGKTYAHPSDIADMNAYLEGFLNKMQSSKTEEYLSLEEAAWHLTNLENYECANANVDYDDIRFDTLCSEVAVANGQVSLSALNTAYQDVKTQIRNLYKGLELDNKNFRYLSSSISESGQIVTSAIMTFNNDSKWYYFPNDDFCDLYFSEDTIYTANTVAVDVLNRLLNLIVGKNTDPNAGRIYYTDSRTEYFVYSNYPDASSPCGYRLFMTTGYHYHAIPKDDMCYYLDSYIGLGKSLENHVTGPYIVYGNVDFLDADRSQCVGNHKLTCCYGVPIANPNHPLFD